MIQIMRHPNADLSPEDFQKLCDKSRGGNYRANFFSTMLCLAVIATTLFICGMSIFLEMKSH